MTSILQLSLRRRVGLTVILMFAVILGLLGQSPIANASEHDYTACGTPEILTLWAGQTINAGTVTIANDAENLYVTFDTAGTGWYLSETHVHVANSLEGIPMTRKGAPKIGNFDYQASFTDESLTTEWTLTLSLADLGYATFDDIVVAAHASVFTVDSAGNVVESETGWAEGDRFVERGTWATYSAYTIQECGTVIDPGGDETEETAFAFGGDVATCFLDIDEDNDGNGDFNRWGWSNGPVTEDVTWEIYAGAGQCDLEKGTLVGTLTVDIVDAFTINVTYAALSGFSFSEYHLYVGNEILDRDVTGEFTVAPGQYDIVLEVDPNESTHTFTVPNPGEPVYVVAHSVAVGDFGD